MRNGHYSNQGVVPLRGAALAEARARRSRNRKPTKERLHLEHNILQRYQAGTVHAPDRMTSER
jgi:hypothetical protein